MRKFLEGKDGDKVSSAILGPSALGASDSPSCSASQVDKVIFCVFRQVDVNSYLDALPAYFPPAPRADKAAKEEEVEANEGDQPE